MKIKKISALILCIALLAGLFEYPLFADEEPNTSAASYEEEANSEAKNASYKIECDEQYVQQYHIELEDAEEYPDNDELLLGFISNAGAASAYSIGTRGLAGVDLTVYEALVGEITKVANGERNNTEFEIKIEDIYLEGYSVKVSGLETYFNENYQIDLSNIVGYLLVNMPFEMYWHNKTIGVRSSVVYGYSYKEAPEGIDGVDAGASYVISLSDITYTISFCVDSAYYPDGTVVPADKFVTGIATTKTSAAAATASNISTVLNENQGKTDYQKLKAYKDKICELTDYNDEAIESGYSGDMNPWQLIYVFDNNPNTKVVCEGYSKAFQYLCDLDGSLESYIVTGYMGGGTGAGPHMWNTVVLDGNNYLVDVTNCDNGVGTEPYSNDSLFLRGEGILCDVSAQSPTIPNEEQSNYELTGFKYETEGVWYTYGNDVRSMYNSIGILDLADSNYNNSAIDLGELAGEGKVKYTLTEEPYTYTGSAIEAVASVSITSPEKVLVEDRDYTINYKNNINAGEASFTITGKGDYKGVCEGIFTIVPKGITVKADDLTVTAGKKLSEISFTCTTTPDLCEGDTLTQPAAYKVLKDEEEISSSTPLEVGEYSVTPVSADAGSNYTITYASGTLTVSNEPCAHTENTCTDLGNGSHRVTCTSCGEIITESEAHTYDPDTWAKEDDTYHQKKCSKCSAISRAVHSWNEGKITTPATCTEAGIKTYTCSVCRGTKTEEITATGIHDYSVYVAVDSDTHKHRCSNCEAVEDETHSFTYEINGSEGHFKKCTICSHSETESHLGNPGEACSKCGYKIPCTIHPDGTYLESSIVWTDGDCTKGGHVTAMCTVCDSSFEMSIPAQSSHSFSNGRCTYCGKTKSSSSSSGSSGSSSSSGSSGSSNSSGGSSSSDSSSSSGSVSSGSSSSYLNSVYYQTYITQAAATLDGRKANPQVFLQQLRQEGQALPANTISMSIGNGAKADIAAVVSSQKDTFNQYAIAGLLLRQIGFTKLTPTLTYNMYSFSAYTPLNTPQTITWSNTGLKYGDIACVVYWNTIKHNIQFIPATVDIFGNVTFTVPNMFGTSIMTLIKCEK